MTEYIKRTAVFEQFDNADADVCETDDFGGVDYGFGMKNIKELINAIPAADVALVVHGLWMPIRESEMTGWDPAVAGRDPIGGYICSVCKEEAVYDCNDEFVLSKYCPNCGAKMDGGDGDAAD
jgi:hypothetical protein|nr:MAG TPA: TFIIB zinc-binding [Caudoviricetes sp.]